MRDPAVRWVRMHRKDDEAWALMPRYIGRIRDFGHQYGLGDVAGLCTRVEASFMVPIETMAGWVALTPTGEMVGHVLACEDLFSARKVGWIVQMVADPGRVPVAMQRCILAEVEAWARGCGYGELMMLTARRQTRAWKRLYGFDEHRLLMRKALEDERPEGVD